MKTIMDNPIINKNESIIRIIKGSILSLGITMILLFVFSIIMTYSNIQESTIVPIIIIITAISILSGSSFSTIKLSKNGMLNGGVVGIIYIIFIYILSSIINMNFVINTNSLILIILGTIAGSIGGIIGVNIK